MLPVLLNLGFVKIYTFGVFLVLAFFWGSFLAWKNFRLSSYREEDLFDSLFLSLAVGLFFSRLVYVALNFNKFGLNILKFILINGYPGLSMYGFLLGGLGAFYLSGLSKKIKFAEGMNYLASAIFLALGLGKLGSFFSGVEVGVPTKFLLSTKYFGAPGLRHLTPLYEALLFFLGAWASYRLLFEVRREKYPVYFNFYFFIWYFSLVYFVVDFLKERQALIYGISLNGTISLILLLTLSFYFLYYFRSLINLIPKHGQKASRNQRSRSAKKA